VAHLSNAPELSYIQIYFITNASPRIKPRKLCYPCLHRKNGRCALRALHLTGGSIPAKRQEFSYLRGSNFLREAAIFSAHLLQARSLLSQARSHRHSDRGKLICSIRSHRCFADRQNAKEQWRYLQPELESMLGGELKKKTPNLRRITNEDVRKSTPSRQYAVVSHT
jgi:hypothetical protein